MKRIVTLAAGIFLVSSCADLPTEPHASIQDAVVQPSSARLAAGESLSLSVTATDGQGGVFSNSVTPRFTALNPSVATVSSSGEVRAVSTGIAEIEVSANGVKKKVQVSVVEPSKSSAASTSQVSYLKLEPATLSKLVGETVRLRVSAFHASGAAVEVREVRWSSSNEGVASVASDGAITAHAPGHTLIRVSFDGLHAEAKLLVSETKREVRMIKVDPHGAVLKIGESLPMKAHAFSESGTILAGHSFQWTSSDASIASVKDGVVTGHKAGKVVIKASAEGKVGEAAIAVVAAPSTVAKVHVQPGLTKRLVGETVEFKATAFSETGTHLPDAKFHWKVSDETLARIDTTGRVHALKPGVVHVFAMAGDIKGQASLTIEAEQSKVAKIRIHPEQASLKIGESLGLLGKAYNENGEYLSGKIFHWSSSDPTVAEIHDGKVTGKKVGRAVIRATLEHLVAEAVILVGEQTHKIAHLKLTAPSTTVIAGETLQLQAQALGADGAPLSGIVFEWKSTHPDVARVDQAGKVFASAPGPTTIAVFAEGKTASLVLSVQAHPSKVTKVKVSPLESKTTAGQKVQFSAHAYNDQGQIVEGKHFVWSTSDTTIATVSGGVVTARKAGKVIVRATTEQIAGEAYLYVEYPAHAVSQIKVAPASLSLTVGQSEHLRASALSATGTVVEHISFTWKSSDPTVISVDASGKVTAHKAGIVKITAHAGDKYGYAEVKATDPTSTPVLHVKVSPESVTLHPGQTQAFSAAAYNSAGVKVETAQFRWTTSDTLIATINPNGVLSVKKAGSVIVYAHTEGGEGKAQVHVTDPSTTISSIKVTPELSHLDIGATQAFSAAAYNSAGVKIETAQFRWTTSDTLIATINPNGVLSVKKAGSVIVYAHAGDRYGKAQVHVTDPATTVASVKLTPETLTVKKGQTFQLQAVAYNAAGTEISNPSFTWSVNDSTLVSHIEAGKFTAKVVGKVIIVAKSGGKSAEAIVYIVE